MKYALIFVFNNLLSMGYAIGLADFVPNFLMAKHKVESIAVQKNAVAQGNSIEYAYNSTVKDTNTRGNPSSSYCRDADGGVKDSVFCSAPKANDVHPSVNTNSTAVANRVVGDVVNNNVAPKQTAMQSQDLRDAMSKYSSSFMLSVKPDKDIDVGMGVSPQGVNGVQVKMKY